MSILKYILDCEYLVNNFQKCLLISLTIILKWLIWKRNWLSDSCHDYFDTDYDVLEFIYFDDIVDYVEFHEYCKSTGLPIREKDYRFNA